MSPAATIESDMHSLSARLRKARQGLSRGTIIDLTPIEQDVQWLCRSVERLSPEEAAGERSGAPRAHLRAITARVRIAPAGSRFEAEWWYLRIARQVMPSEYRALLDRWHAWFVHVDVSEQIPRLRKLDLAGSGDRDGPGRRAPRGMLLGPIRDKEAAGRLMEHLTDLFDLCRGTAPGRSDSNAITLFKSVGTALEDLAAARLVAERLSA